MLSRRALAAAAGAAALCLAVGGVATAGSGHGRTGGFRRIPQNIRVSTVRFDTGDVIDIIPPERAVPGRPPEPTRHLPFLTALAARPKSVAARSAVMVIHDDVGLDRTAQAFAASCAASGLAAYAIDALSPYGGTPSGRTIRDRDRARQAVRQLDPDKTLAKFSHACAAIDAQYDAVGVAGFGWGAMLALRLAAAHSGIRAVVAYLDDVLVSAETPDNGLLVPLGEEASNRSIERAVNFLTDRLRA